MHYYGGDVKRELIIGYSTDTKPTSGYHLGAIFEELDTGDSYVFNKDGTWTSNLSSAGTAGSGVYTFSIPSGYTIDTNLAIIPSAISSVNVNYAGVDGSTLGFGTAGGYTSVLMLTVVPLSSTTVGLYICGSSDNNLNNTLIGSNACAISVANRFYKFTAEIPIL
jgi:hypothetical protein